MSTDIKFLPQPVDKIEMAFGGDMAKLLPDYKTVIPDEFKGNGNKWNKIFSTWFFSGLSKDTEFYPKEGIKLDEAIAHLRAIMASWQPKHEHKESGCAYLMSLWFDDIVIPKK